MRKLESEERWPDIGWLGGGESSHAQLGPWRRSGVTPHQLVVRAWRRQVGRTVHGRGLPAGYSENSRGGGGDGVSRVTGIGAMLGGAVRTEREPSGPRTGEGEPAVGGEVQTLREGGRTLRGKGAGC